MKIVSFFSQHRLLGWAFISLVALCVGLLSAIVYVQYKEKQRLSLLETEVQRSGIELMSQTLNGNLMGSITLLGLLDGNVKLEAANQSLPSGADNMVALTTLGDTFGAEGVFIVGGDGIVKSSWDRDNKPSTGWDVNFRPYYRMAIKGEPNVYAAVSMARGDRALYFAAPIFEKRTKAASGIGVMVARTTLTKVDELLKSKADSALLLSPQGVVFASSNPAWMGYMEGVPSEQDLQKIRDLKQFGAQFEKVNPKILPLTSATSFQTVNGQKFAVASSSVSWNDPSGPWKLVLMEDTSRSVPWQPSAVLGLFAGLVVLALAWMTAFALRGVHAQQGSRRKLEEYAHLQEANAAFRSRLALLTANLQRCESLQDLSQRFLQESREMMGAIQGVVYLSHGDAEPRLTLAAAMACASAPPTPLAMGETLLGQCAVERQIRVIDTPPGGYWTVSSGLGKAVPAALLLMPVMMQDTLIGALELALLKMPDDAQLQDCSEVVAQLAFAVEILGKNLQIRSASGSHAELSGATP